MNATADLHWDTLMASWGPPSLLDETIAWDAPDRIQLDRRIVPVLGGEILLLFLCIHFAFHHVLDGLILMRKPLSQHLTCRAAWSTSSFAQIVAHVSLIKRASAFPCLPP